MNFTPAVYWHYINTQYFPHKIQSDLTAFSKLKKMLEVKIGTYKLQAADLDAYEQSQKVDQVLTVLEKEFMNCVASNTNIGEAIISRAKNETRKLSECSTATSGSVYTEVDKEYLEVQDKEHFFKKVPKPTACQICGEDSEDILITCGVL